jgi:ATP phosphoribosyltransferase
MTFEADRLRVAVQRSGRLAAPTGELLRLAGMKLPPIAKTFWASVENFPADILLVRDDDIPILISEGVCDLGIVGLNVVEEFGLGCNGAPLKVLRGLSFGECRLTIAASKEAQYTSRRSLAGARIATSYPRLLRRFLLEASVTAEIVRISGGVELAPRLGLAPFICDLVATGDTLRANGLQALETVLKSEAVLVRSAGGLSPAKEELSCLFLSSIDRALAALASHTLDSDVMLMNLG